MLAVLFFSVFRTAFLALAFKSPRGLIARCFDARVTRKGVPAVGRSYFAKIFGRKCWNKISRSHLVWKSVKRVAEEFQFVRLKSRFFAITIFNFFFSHFPPLRLLHSSRVIFRFQFDISRIFNIIHSFVLIFLAEIISCTCEAFNNFIFGTR